MRPRRRWSGLLAASIAVVLVVGACTDVGEPAPDTAAAPLTPLAEPSTVASRSPTPSPTPSPSPSPSPSPTLPPAPDRSALVALLAEATAALPETAEVSMVVLDQLGREVHQLNGHRRLLPASTAKLLTGAAALLEHGPDHRFTTSVRATGPIRDGVVAGSIVLVGGGDPALDTEDYRTLVYRTRPHTSLEDLASAVADAGVRRVSGRVVVAEDGFGGTPEAPGWKDSYVPRLEARRITSLTVDGGLDITVLREPPDPRLRILAADDPQQVAGVHFRDALRAVDVALPSEPSSSTAPAADDGADGPTDDDGEPDAPPPPPPVVVRASGPPASSLPEVASITSPPLLDLVRFSFERSDNHMADMLFRQLGAVDGATDWRSAGAAVEARLARLGVDTAGLELVDGSGLSRAHEVSAHHLAQTDQLMRSGPLGAQWRDAQAEAGSEGTLRGRLVGTVAEGRFTGKTGTLDDVTAIAGTVEGPDGEPAYHVAAIANVPPSIGRAGPIAVFDDVIALLAEDAAGCRRVPPSAGDGGSEDESPAPGEVVGGLSVECPA